MPNSRWLVVALACSLVVTPTISTAHAQDSARTQLKDEPQDFTHDVLGALAGPHWNIFAHGGLSLADRFLVQQTVTPVAGQRALEGSTGYNVGGGVGVDILLRTGLRASYTFTSNNLKFRTDNGDGSTNLDVSDVGTLKSHTASLEIVHFMLPTRATINPYGTLGVQGTWWKLDQKSPLVTSNGASTPFGVSPLFSFGVQFRASDHFSGRLEGALSGGHNPFAGNKAFHSPSGLTIDEPSGISRTDFRVAAVYHFSAPQMPKAPGPLASR